MATKAAAVEAVLHPRIRQNRSASLNAERTMFCGFVAALIGRKMTGMDVSLYYRQRSLARVARTLEATGTKNRAGRPFSRPALNYILRNRIYLGEIKYGSARAKSPELRIVTPATWNRAAKVRKAQRRRKVVPPLPGIFLPGHVTR